MLISLNWLKQYVDIKEDIHELSRALTMIGQEVEKIEVQGESLDNVVIGQIVEYDKHPNSDRLTLLKVNVGEEENLQIICGATNHKLNDKVVVAKIGAELPGNFKIKKSKIRDVESCGMLCSEKELGLSDESQGIIILPEDATIGMLYKDYLGLNDVIFELEITPNRPDCLSYIGIAREIAAYYNRKVKYPIINLIESIESVNTVAKVEIEDKNRCKRYVGRAIKNVKIGPSPRWLQERIISMGLKPINNVVDITNFIMFEYNQPTHAFDLDKIEDKFIRVREAVKGEKITTLDGVERTLENGELVIADSKKALAIAGVIGGQNSEIDENTTNVFLEMAYFTPENIRKTSRNLGIFTDSAYRNERGIDRENILEVMNRGVSLIQEVAGGEILSETIDRYVEKYESREIPLNIEKLSKFAGKDIDADKIGLILANLDIKIKTIDTDNMLLEPPSFREDLKETSDIYEEIIRMYGFENIEAKMPTENIKSGVVNENIRITDISKNILANSGLVEVINYSFIPNYTKEIFGYEEEIIEIKNPLSEDMAIMRPELIFSLLSNVKDNLSRNENDIKIFEISKTFEKTSGELAKEDIKIGIAIAGRPDKNIWNDKNDGYNFYTLKGYVENLFESLHVKKYNLTRSNDFKFHPGISATVSIGKDVIGNFGEVHPKLLEKLGIKKERIFYAEFNLTILKKYINLKFKYEPISKYPVVFRDLAVVVDKDILVGNMIKEIKNNINLIEKIDIFDIYQGDKITANKKSVAMSIALRDRTKTLNDVEIDATMNEILDLIKTKYGGEIRQ